MKTTLTVAHRNTKQVFRPVQNGQIVRISDHGKPFAKISPDYPVKEMTPDEFRALPISDEELDKAINAALAEVRA